MTGQQLKNSILQMAVQGKLVPQDPNDEPASVLLEKIRKEKEQLIKEGKIKKEKNPSRIFRGADNLPYEQVGKNEPVCIADEVPFEIPENWEWVRLGNILQKLSDGTHSTPKYVECGIPFISVKDVSSGVLDFSNCKYISKEEHTDLYARCNPEFGDILLTKVGTTGIPVIVDKNEEFSLFVSVALLKFNQNRLYNEFLIHLINSPLVQKQASENTKGVGNKNWVMRDIANTLIVIPPLKEQYRIVSELKKYNHLLLEYSKKENKLAKLNNNFPELLKKSILQKAIQGKLVPQNPNDEPASVLLERIRAEKQKLIAEGKIKKDKKESVIFRRDNSHYEKLNGIERCIDDEIPFEIPESWVWARLGQLVGIQRGASPRPKGSPEYWSNERTPHHWIKISDITKYSSNDTLLDTDEFLTDLGATKSVFVDEDYIITAASGSLGKIAKLGITGYIYDGLMCLCFKGISLEKDYIILLIQTMVEFLMSVSTGTAWKNITTDILKNLLVPLPPQAEQHRIISKTKELSKLIDII